MNVPDPDLHPAYEKMNPQRWPKKNCPGRYLFVLGIWEKTSFWAQTIWVIT